MYYQYSTIRKSTRDQIIEIYPGIKKSKEYQTFLCWLLNNNVLDNEKRFTHFSFIAAMLGKVPSNFSTLKFLKAFQKDTGINLNVTDYCFTKGEAREITPEIDMHVIELIKQENRIPAKDKKDRVYFVGGDRYSPRKQSQKIRADQNDAYQDASSIITTYFRDINPVVYNPFYENIDNLIELTRDNADLSDGERDNYLAALQFLNDNLSPRYHDRESYERVFAEGYSLQNLKRDLRKGILKGTLEADLVSSQLTLAAYIWDIPEIKTLLESGVNIWKHIFKELGIPFSNLLKPEIKNALYATIYGAGEDGIKQELKSFSDEQKDSFLNLTVIKALRRQQKAAAKEIENNKGVMSPQGVWIKKWGNPNKTLAKLMQAYEKIIIEELYKVATRYPDDIRILSHEHDGVSISILKKDRIELNISRLENAVREKSIALGIPMSLEFKE